ncbi:MAG: type II/IV secretion system protein [Nitrospirae bacterium]|nr:type II/IV secretion system protein [Nitrospirota bacterium]
MPELKVRDEELQTLLVEQLGVIDRADFNRASTLAQRLRSPLIHTLVEQGRIPQAFLLEQLARSWNVGFVDLTIGHVKGDIIGTLQESFARKHLLVPFDREGDQLHVAMADPRERNVVSEIERITGLRVSPFLATEPSIRRAQLLYKKELREILDRSTTEKTTDLTPAKQHDANESTIVDAVQRLLLYAAVTRASDIHIEPFEFETVVRYRVDGVMREVFSLTPALQLPLVSRIKILSGMRIDERRIPQDGRFEANLDGFKVDLRVASVPTQWGEKIVLRILSKDNVIIDLEDLGLVPPDYQIILRNIMKPFGMVLITGPTGSGKSTTLYAMLMRIGTERQNIVNISTIEEPVEYSIPRVNQTQVNHQTGVQFSTGLRALLRQDPDVIMVGEIRDKETAEIAVQAALVGRLLLSTLHTNDSTGSIPRLLDIGVEPYLLSSSLTLVVAQRLTRRICKNCRESVTPNSRILESIQSRPDFSETIDVLKRQGILRKTHNGLAGVRLYNGKGCVQCQGSGFSGRLGLFEIFEVDEDIRDLIMQRKPASFIRSTAIMKGMKTMFQDGLAKAFMGETTIEEVFRVAL